MSALLLLSTADTDLLALRRAEPHGFGPIEALNPTRVDTDGVQRLAAAAREGAYWAVGLRLLGGRRAFPEGFDVLRSACAEAGVPFGAWPGEHGQDLELEAASSVPRGLLGEAGRYWDEGGVENLRNLLQALSDALRGTSYGCAPPAAVPRNGVYRRRTPTFGRPVIAIAFYRAHWMSGNLDFVDDLCRAVEAAGGEPHAFFCYSLRDEGQDGLPAAIAECLIEDDRLIADCLLLSLSFAVAELQVAGGAVADEWTAHWLERLDIPVIQAVTSTGSRAAWASSSGGLAPLDVAMQVALPEFDGRIIGPPFSFKEEVNGTIRYVADRERCAALARLAVAHARLRSKPNQEKRLAIVLSGYPTRNARVGNAVGLDTPASALGLLRRLKDEGYEVGELPASGDDLIHALIEAGAYDREHLTSEQMRSAPAGQPAPAYAEAFTRLSEPIRQSVEQS